MSRVLRKTSFWLCGLALMAALPLSLPAQQEMPGRPPELGLRDSGGQQHSLADYHEKIVILNFWATWCIPCKNEMPVFSEVQRRYGPEGVQVLAASLDDSSTKQYVPRFAHSYKMDFPILLDATADHMQKLGLGEVAPSTAFLDRDGHIVFRILGQASRSDVESRVQWLLGNRQGTAPEALLDHSGKKKR